MPIYEYQCGACGHELEALQKISDDSLVHCPECHGAALKKKMSAAGFQLKGTGWYETDFKNSGSKKGSESASCKPGSGACNHGSNKGDSTKAKAGNGDKSAAA